MQPPSRLPSSGGGAGYSGRGAARRPAPIEGNDAPPLLLVEPSCATEPTRSATRQVPPPVLARRGHRLSATLEVPAPRETDGGWLLRSSAEPARVADHGGPANAPNPYPALDGTKHTIRADAPPGGCCSRDPRFGWDRPQRSPSRQLCRSTNSGRLEPRCPAEGRGGVRRQRGLG